MAKGEIARFEQCFLLSPRFQKSSAADESKCVYMWERVNYINQFIHTSHYNTHLRSDHCFDYRFYRKRNGCCKDMFNTIKKDYNSSFMS